MNTHIRLCLNVGIFLMSTLCLHAQEQVDIYKFRTIDGTHNDLRSTEEGRANQAFVRKGPANYKADGNSIIDGPNPRYISNLLCDQSEDLINSYGLSSLVFTFLQFIDHDITATEGGHDFMPISVPQGDIHFDPMNTGQVMIPFTRSAMTGSGTSINNPRTQNNEITAWLDGSGVYGSDETRAAWLRSGECGKLKVHKSENGDLMPCNTPTGDCNEDPDGSAPSMAMDTDRDGTLLKMFVAGDVRANEQPGLTALHVLFVREHNRICDELMTEGSCDDEANYQKARRKVGALIQAIMYNEISPLLGLDLGSASYNRDMSSEIFNSFAASAYRIGHTMISDNIELMMTDCGEVDRKLSLAEAFFNPSIVIDSGVEGILRGLNKQAQQEVDLQMVPEVRNLLFGPPGAGGLDLAALNIQRARDHGLPFYNTMREEYGMAPVASFADITQNTEVQIKLKDIYGSVDSIDSWVAFLAEDHVSGSPFGESLKVILSDQFNRIRKADRFYFSRDRMLKRSERTEIAGTSLSDVIKRNTAVTDMDYAFLVSSCNQDVVAYCEPKVNNTQYAWIGNVNVNGEGHESANTAGYNDYTEVVMTMTPGTNSLSLRSDNRVFSFKKLWNVWIDMDGNGHFDNTELVFSEVSRDQIEGTIEIPEGITRGDTRMRVMMSLFLNDDACDNVSFGEVEDYTVSFAGEAAVVSIKQFQKDNKLEELFIEDDLKVYPNPARDQIRLTRIMKTQNQETFIVVNALGQTQLKGSTDELENGLDVSAWNDGTYFIQVFDKTGKTRSISFVIQR